MALLSGLFSGAASLLPKLGGGLLKLGKGLLGNIGGKIIGGIGNAIGSLFGGGDKRESSSPQQSGEGQMHQRAQQGINYGANQMQNWANQGINYGANKLGQLAQQGISKLPISQGMRDQLGSWANQGIQYGAGMLGDFAQQGINYGKQQIGNFAQQGIDKAGQWAGQQLDRFSQGFNQRFGGANLPEGAAMVDQGGYGSRVMLNPNQMARRRIMQPQMMMY